LSNFIDKGYVYIPNLLDEDSTELVSSYFDNKVARGEIREDSDGTTKITYYADPLTEVLLKRMVPFVENTIGEEVFPTYSYFRIYQPKEILSKHTDRPSCEISMTVSIAKVGSTSRVYMQAEGREASSFSLSVGDAVLYEGCKIKHWREPLEDNQLVVQCMLHYVRKNGPNAGLIYDGRSRLGEISCQ